MRAEKFIEHEMKSCFWLCSFGLPAISRELKADSRQPI